jgi:DNA topoisomerase-2
MLRDWLSGQSDALDRPLKPWFRGFKGSVSADGTAVGVYRKEKDEFVVTELPPETWTADYRERLEKELAEGRIKDFTDVSTDTDIHIRIRGISEEALVKSLTTKFKTTNMHAFNSKGVIAKYETPNAILHEYAVLRLALYEKRRLHQMTALESELPYHSNVVRFIKDQIADRPQVDLRRKTREVCDSILTTHKYDRVDGSYDYILRLPVSSFTAEQIAKHETQLADLKSNIERLKNLKNAEMWLNELGSV